MRPLPDECRGTGLEEWHAHLSDAGRVRRGDPLGEQADRGRRHRGRRLRRAWPRAGPSTRRCGSRTGPSSRRSSATRRTPTTARSWRAPTSRTRSTASSRTAASLCWIVRVGADEAPRRPRAALPAATDKSVEAFRAVALEGVDGPRHGRADAGSAGRRRRRRRQGGRGRPTRSIVTRRRPSARSTRASRSRRAATTSPPRSTPPRKLIKIEETGASLPETPRRAGQVHALGARAARPSKVAPTRLRGRRRHAQGHGRPRRGRRGHDGRDARHHDPATTATTRSCATCRAR